MKTADFLRTEFKATADLLAKLQDDSELMQKVDQVVLQCARAILAGGKLMFCGNGGSAADSQHLAAEMVGKFNEPRPAMAGIALTTDTSALTAIGNDFGYDFIFSRQVEGIGRSGDVLIGISTSGRSRNVVEAMLAAKRLGICSVAMTGRAQGPVSEAADIWLPIPHDSTPKIQEGHIILGHAFCGLVEQAVLESRANSVKVA